MRRPKILVTGAQGQVGHELAHLLGAHADVVAIDRAALDLADPDAIVSAMRASRPDIVVNAGAYTAVDAAERERDAAFAVNARAPQVLADEAKRADARADPLLDRLRVRRRRDDALRRGRADGAAQRLRASKLEGERAIAASGARALVLRTSWVYGLRGRNFLLTIRRLAAERDELRIVADQTGTPNWARTLAQATADLVARGARVPGRTRGPLSPELDGRDDVARLRAAIVGDVAAAARPADRAAPSTRRPRAGPPTACWRRPAFAPRSASSCPSWRDALAACLAASAPARRD